MLVINSLRISALEMGGEKGEGGEGKESLTHTHIGRCVTVQNMNGFLIGRYNNR